MAALRELPLAPRPNLLSPCGEGNRADRAASAAGWKRAALQNMARLFATHEAAFLRASRAARSHEACADEPVVAT